MATMGEVIGLAAQAGNIIGQARADRKDVATLCDEAGITDEEAKRYERVAAHQHKIANGETGSIRQGYLWAGLLPDPITTSEPGEPKPFLSPVIRAAQFVNNRGIKFIRQDDDLRKTFLREAKPIVDAYEELSR